MILEFRSNIQAVVYRKLNGKNEFLLAHRIKNWDGWEFVKGGVKVGETHEEAVKRELQEEAGIKSEDLIKLWKTHFNTIIEYPKNISEKCGYKGSLNKTYLVEVKNSTEVNLPKNNSEHSELIWVMENKMKSYLSYSLFSDFLRVKKIIESYERIYSYALRSNK